MGIAAHPGTTRVLDRATLKLVPCDKERCPLAEEVVMEDGVALVNRPILLQSTVVMLNGLSPLQYQFYAYGLFSMLSSSSLLGVGGGNGLLLDPNELLPMRQSDFSSDQLQYWVQEGYDAGDAARFLAVYRKTATSENIVSEIKIRMSTNVTAALYAAALTFNSPATSASALPGILARMESALDAIVAAEGGTDAFAQQYRRQHQIAGNAGGSADSFESAPGVSADTTCLTLVVTDIYESTTLWEKLPVTVMDAAVSIHHAIIRQALAARKGYEAATEGDSFILSFKGPADAAAFCLYVQQALLTAPWPAELMQHRDLEGLAAGPGGGDGDADGGMDAVDWWAAAAAVSPTATVALVPRRGPECTAVVGASRSSRRIGLNYTFKRLAIGKRAAADRSMTAAGRDQSLMISSSRRPSALFIGASMPSFLEGSAAAAIAELVAADRMLDATQQLSTILDDDLPTMAAVAVDSDLAPASDSEDVQQADGSTGPPGSSSTSKWATAGAPGRSKTRSSGNGSALLGSAAATISMGGKTVSGTTVAGAAIAAEAPAAATGCERRRAQSVGAMLLRNHSSTAAASVDEVATDAAVQDVEAALCGGGAAAARPTAVAQASGPARETCSSMAHPATADARSVGSSGVWATDVLGGGSSVATTNVLLPSTSVTTARTMRLLPGSFPQQALLDVASASLAGPHKAFAGSCDGAAPEAIHLPPAAAAAGARARAAAAYTTLGFTSPAAAGRMSRKRLLRASVDMLLPRQRAPSATQQQRRPPSLPQGLYGAWASVGASGGAAALAHRSSFNRSAAPADAVGAEPSAGPGNQHVVFRGLRVRMGIHSSCGSEGEVEVSRNAASGRVQYSGALLRLAKAVSDVGQGGMILLSQATRDALQQAAEGESPAALQKALGGPFVVLWMGKHTFADGAGDAHLYQVVSMRLLGRLALQLQTPERTLLRKCAPVPPLERGVFDAPTAGMGTLARISVVGAPTLMAWNAEVTTRALALMYEMLLEELRCAVEAAAFDGAAGTGTASQLPSQCQPASCLLYNPTADSSSGPIRACVVEGSEQLMPAAPVLLPRPLSRRSTGGAADAGVSATPSGMRLAGAAAGFPAAAAAATWWWPQQKRVQDVAVMSGFSSKPDTAGGAKSGAARVMGLLGTSFRAKDPATCIGHPAAMTVAFSGPPSIAAQWLLSCMTRLPTLDWPPELLEHPLAEDIAFGSGTGAVLVRMCGLRAAAALACGDLGGAALVPGALSGSLRYQDTAAAAVLRKAAAATKTGQVVTDAATAALLAKDVVAKLKLLAKETDNTRS
ncbi:hypothetical protein HXX76_007318 [Chlamydomonas incerta]|uniref:Guanylate cyclase domain-containing protein n=1 Tax=Chlamydomonas incerta TaxID=51695 RepID=A0A835TAB9_CHLIN|nr:hypothetical protein HXX76_007318 [Chlamydomonas incerta]|eukprot:KAG2435240.1 hypothetical protein HXX76_007318 [Chlamydomonas incerta]